MSFEQEWNSIGSKIEPPRGSYKVEIVEGDGRYAWESKDGRKFAKVYLKILNGELAGTQFEHFMNLQPPGIAEMNKNALLGYGLSGTIKSVEDLGDRIADLRGRTADVGVSYKDGYMNVNVHGSRNKPGEDNGDIPNDFTTPNKPQQAPAADFATAAGTAGDDDSLPF